MKNQSVLSDPSTDLWKFIGEIKDQPTSIQTKRVERFLQQYSGAIKKIFFNVIRSEVKEVQALKTLRGREFAMGILMKEYPVIIDEVENEIESILCNDEMATSFPKVIDFLKGAIKQFDRWSDCEIEFAIDNQKNRIIYKFKKLDKYLSNRIAEYERQLIELNSPQSKGKVQAQYNSFKLSTSQLKKAGDVLDDLQAAKLISENVKVPKFKKIFSGDIVENKIQWVGSIAALHFFVCEICKYSTIKKRKSEIACKCFSKEGYELTSKKLNNNKASVSPEDKENITKAVQYFQTTTRQ